MFANVEEGAHPRNVARANTGVYDMARIREIMALDEEARGKLAVLISDDLDAFDLPGKMNDFDVNELILDSEEARDKVIEGYIDDEFLGACCGGDVAAARAAINEIKAWLLPKCGELAAAGGGEEKK
mmetsp:Transcript_29209/g.93560  ORF Transcript_29209/g.93560 Transcript_29209/m.93560 type:complete len:127 (-) Transcript_29209:2736-3116(-)|eukprot:CAMPEP_0118878144 /NCGR_PEP_ID=MMETSP1163-20130328/18173_1 /TAXON_ID=124430 /ORGANISM="Phaeomonas parva, Strain CCMP2877" /LENGTH=126 /DNA_ID=CAMNT_0006813943 /DNA_START=143 /DNA_END=523 /DNA_ORIENTATION=+